MSSGLTHCILNRRWVVEIKSQFEDQDIIGRQFPGIYNGGGLKHEMLFHFPYKKLMEAVEVFPKHDALNIIMNSLTPNPQNNMSTNDAYKFFWNPFVAVDIIDSSNVLLQITLAAQRNHINIPTGINSWQFVSCSSARNQMFDFVVYINP